VECWKIHLKYSSSYVTWRCSTILQLWSASMAVKNLSWTLDWSRKWSSIFLSCVLTWFQSAWNSILWMYFESNVYANTDDTWEKILFAFNSFASDINNTTRIFESLLIYFSRRVELHVRQYGGHFEQKFYVCTSRNDINDFFVSFPLIHNLSRVGIAQSV
jgi:hypothetical protein